MKKVFLTMVLLASSLNASALTTTEEFLEAVQNSGTLGAAYSLVARTEGADNYELQVLNPFNDLNDEQQKDCTGYSKSGNVAVAIFTMQGRAISAILFGTSDKIEDLRICGKLKIKRFGE